MANIPKAILDLLDNAKTAAFAKSLKHSDLPANWDYDPEIVDLAAKAWQEAGTDSPFFKAWFGDSKVVDDAGKPMQVYHGTPDGGFEEFYPGQTWVTPERRYANEYADKRMYESMADDSFGDYGIGFDVEEEVPEVFELFSKSKKPIDVGEIGFEIDDDGINALSKITSIPRSQLNKIAKTNDAKWMWEITGSPDFLEIAQDKGFDGIKALERFNPTYATFEPTQVKSVNNRGTFNPADPNIYRTVAPFGVGTAAMAAALLGDGSEAEAAVSPKFKELFVDALITGSKKPIYAGEYEDTPYSRLLKIYPEAQNSVWVSPDHPLVRRMKTQGWSAERTADEIGNLLNSPDTEFVKNWSTKKNASAYGALLPYDVDPLFAPFDLVRGESRYRTIFPPNWGNMKELGYGAGGGKSLISRFQSQEAMRTANGTPGTQQQPISVVRPQPEFKNTIRGLDAIVNKKALIPPAILATALGTPTEAQGAWRPPEEPGLEEPWWSPADLFVAPVGVAGKIPAKLLAMAADAPATIGISAALEKLFGK